MVAVRDASPTEAAAGIRWWHSIDLGDGTVSKGHKAPALLQAEADIAFKHGVRGKSVLDIGAWDGFFSFEAERRGATRVVASDDWGAQNPGRAGFDFARARRKSRVDALPASVFELDPAKHGRFDTVLFLGVLYHLKDPLGGLDRAAGMTKDMLVVETALAAEGVEEPVARFFLGAEFANDATNYWAPNVPCLVNMLKEVGFSRIEITPHPIVHPPPRKFEFFRRWWAKPALWRCFAHAQR